MPFFFYKRSRKAGKLLIFSFPGFMACINHPSSKEDIRNAADRSWLGRDRPRGSVGRRNAELSGSNPNGCPSKTRIIRKNGSTRTFSSRRGRKMNGTIGYF
jgi:hypothetical protein